MSQSNFGLLGFIGGYWVSFGVIRRFYWGSLVLLWLLTLFGGVMCFMGGYWGEASAPPKLNTITTSIVIRFVHIDQWRKIQRHRNVVLLIVITMCRAQRRYVFFTSCDSKLNTSVHNVLKLTSNRNLITETGCVLDVIEKCKDRAINEGYCANFLNCANKAEKGHPICSICHVKYLLRKGSPIIDRFKEAIVECCKGDPRLYFLYISQ